MHSLENYLQFFLFAIWIDIQVLFANFVVSSAFKKQSFDIIERQLHEQRQNYRHQSDTQELSDIELRVRKTLNIWEKY